MQPWWDQLLSCQIFRTTLWGVSEKRKDGTANMAELQNSSFDVWDGKSFFFGGENNFLLYFLLDFFLFLLQFLKICVGVFFVVFLIALFPSPFKRWRTNHYSQQHGPASQLQWMTEFVSHSSGYSCLLFPEFCQEKCPGQTEMLAALSPLHSCKEETTELPQPLEQPTEPSVHFLEVSQSHQSYAETWSCCGQWKFCSWPAHLPFVITGMKNPKEQLCFLLLMWDAINLCHAGAGSSLAHCKFGMGSYL